MPRDAKDDIIGELEFQLTVARKKITDGQALNCVLERHSHLLETRLKSATKTICNLRKTVKELGGQTKKVTRQRRALVVLDSDPDYEDDDDELEEESHEAMSTSEEDDERVQIKEQTSSGAQSLLFSEQLGQRLMVPNAIHCSIDTPQPDLSIVKAIAESSVNYNCYLCDYSTTIKYRLSSHFRVHSGEKPFVCDHLVSGEPCGRRFAHKHYLQKHWRVHTGEKPYKCTFGKCTSKFSNSSNLTLHLARHKNEKKWKCSECDYETVAKYHLDKHFRNIHLKLKPHKCEYCSKRFPGTDGLQDHIRRIHRDD